MKSIPPLPHETPLKIRRTKVDWLNHVNAWKTSGQTQQLYCQINNLCYRQFNQWKSRFKKENQLSGVASEADSIPVTVSSLPEASNTNALKVILPNEIEVSLPIQNGSSSVLSLIQQLASLSC